MKFIGKLNLMAIIGVCLGSHLSAQDAAPEATEHHKILAQEAGEWTGEMKVFANGPDADPMVVPVTEKNVMMDTGLWLISDFAAGPFKGHGQFGYDPTKKKYVGTWIDNQTMSLAVMEGTHDEKTGETTYLSKMMNPISGKVEPTKSVGKMLDENSKQFVMYMKASTGDGWSKWMEVSYKRKSTN